MPDYLIPEDIVPEDKPTVLVEKQEVTASHPLQYRFVTYKRAIDINGAEVQIEDKVEIKNTLELDSEIVQIGEQILALQKRIDDIKAKQLQIAEITPLQEKII